MAEHSSDNHAHGMEEHPSTYDGFIKGSVALSIICGFVLVSLVSFRFRPYAQCFYRVCGLDRGYHRGAD